MDFNTTFEIIKALVMGAVPVCAFTFVILQWSINSGRMDAFDSEGNLRQQHRAATKAQKKTKKASTPDKGSEFKLSGRAGGDLVHGKIMFFGGGFYGTMAVMTYLLIEVIEIWNFLGAAFSSGNWFPSIDVDMIVNLLINSLMNLVAAFLWFQTLADYVEINNGWIWLIASYLGYLAGLKIVTLHGYKLWTAIVEYSTTAGKWLKRKL